MKRSILLTLAMALGVASTAVARTWYDIPEGKVWTNGVTQTRWDNDPSFWVPSNSAFDMHTVDNSQWYDYHYEFLLQGGTGPDGEGAIRDTGTVDPKWDDVQVQYIEIQNDTLIKSKRNMSLIQGGFGLAWLGHQGHTLTLDFAKGKGITFVNVCNWSDQGTLKMVSGGLTAKNPWGGTDCNLELTTGIFQGQDTWIDIVEEGGYKANLMFHNLYMSDGAKLFGSGNLYINGNDNIQTPGTFKPSEKNSDFAGKLIFWGNNILDLSGLNGTWKAPVMDIDRCNSAMITVKPGTWATSDTTGAEKRIIYWTTKPSESKLTFVLDSSVPTGWNVIPRADGLYILNAAIPPKYARRDVSKNKWVFYNSDWSERTENPPEAPTAEQIVYFNDVAEYNALVSLKGSYSFSELQMRGGEWYPNTDTDLSGLDFVIADVRFIGLGNNARLTMTGKSAASATSGWLYPNNSSKAVVELTVPGGETATFDGHGYYIGGEAAENQNLQMEKTGKGRLQINNFALEPNVYPSWIVKEGVLAKTGGKAAFGRQNTTVRVNAGAQVDLGDRGYWDYSYEIAGDGPDGTGALTASKVFDNEGWGLLDSTKHTGCLHDLTLTADASVDAPAGKPWPLSFWANDKHYVTFNNHTLTLGMTECVYWVNLRPTDAGKLVIGKSEVYNCWTPWGETVARIDDQFIDMSKVDIEVKTELVANRGCFFSPIKSLKFEPEAAWRHASYWEADSKVSEEFFPVVVHDAYRPSMNKMPQITLGAAGHLTPTLDLSTLTGTLDGDRLSFYAGSTVTVDVGQRDLSQSQKLVSWTTKPTNVNFKLTSKYGSYRVDVRDDGLYAVTGIAIILQ